MEDTNYFVGFGTEVDQEKNQVVLLLVKAGSEEALRIPFDPADLQMVITDLSNSLAALKAMYSVNDLLD